jgi:tetratricopeptide (TPR) repeat protein
MSGFIDRGWKTGWRVLGVAAALAGICPAAGWGEVHTNPMNRDPEVREAYVHFYDMDFPGAASRFERFHEEHPGDPQATDLLLNSLIFEELYRMDLLDTTFYANDGFLTGKHAVGAEDPQKRDRIFALADEAVKEADWRISQNAKDVDALYARAWARSLRCAYMAMAERAFGAGFKLAGKAKDDDKKVLELDPDYVDAKMVVGVYEYVVGALPLPFKILIGFAGITGSKATGIALLEDAGKRSAAVSVESRTVITLFLRRESKYKKAIEVVRELKREYPRNYLFWLEEANLRKDDGQGMAAVDAYREIVAQAEKPGFFSSARLELTYFGLGDAQRGQRHFAEAAEAYEKAALTPGVGTELKVRSMLAGGECRDMQGERDAAVRDYQAAIDTAPQTSRADQARRRLKNAYKGK